MKRVVLLVVLGLFGTVLSLAWAPWARVHPTDHLLRMGTVWHPAWNTPTDPNATLELDWILLGLQIAGIWTALILADLAWRSTRRS